MLKNLIIILAVDFIIISIWLLSAQLDNSMSIVGITIPPTIFIANVVIGVILLLFKKLLWGSTFFINSIVASALFIFLLQRWFIHSHKIQYTEFSFVKDKKKFKILIGKRSSDFNILEIIDVNASKGTMYGSYSVRHDTTFLVDIRQKKNCFIYRDKLYGFEKNNKPITLKIID